MISAPTTGPHHRRARCSTWHKRWMSLQVEDCNHKTTYQPTCPPAGSHRDHRKLRHHPCKCPVPQHLQRHSDSQLMHGCRDQEHHKNAQTLTASCTPHGSACPQFLQQPLIWPSSMVSYMDCDINSPIETAANIW